MNEQVQRPDPNDDAVLLEQLSAFMDGELDADRSRFLLQRLAHDGELRARWERWQLHAAALRKLAQPLPAGFAERVAQAVADLPVAAPAVAGPVAGRRRRWLGGIALAASLAVAGIFTFDMLHVHQRLTAPAVAAAHPPPAPVLPITRTEMAAPEPAIKLPIPVHAGVVVAFRQPLRPSLAREPAPPRANFQPFPQPYVIDPELEAYLLGQKAGRSHDVFREDAASNGNGAVRTASWPVQP